MKTNPPASPLRFSRLLKVETLEVMALLNDPEIARHMPLAGDAFDEAGTLEWLKGKDAQWEQNGYGPWAVHVEGEFAGWGGFQKEGDDADFALVLKPRFWGKGHAICRTAVGKGFEELGFKSIVVTLPPSRKTFRVLSRLGYRPDAETEHSGERFLRFRLSRDAWSRSKTSRG